MPYDENGNFYSSSPKMPVFDEDRQDAFTDSSSVLGSDLASVYRTGDEYIDRRRAKQHQIITMAALNGDVPHDTALEMMDVPSDDRNLIEKIYGLTAHGTNHDILSPLIDLFSPGLYASAAYSKSKMDSYERETRRARSEGEIGQDETLPWHNQTRWAPWAISGGDFKKYYQNRTIYGDVFDVEYNLLGGDGLGGRGPDASAWRVLGLDIFADPVFWTGIGAVGKVLRVAKLAPEAAKQFARSGAKGAIAQPIRATGKRIPLTRGAPEDLVERMMSPEGIQLKTSGWAEKIHRRTLRVAEREATEELAEEAARLGNAGRSPHESQLMREIIEERVPRMMIERYDEIAGAVWKEDSNRILKLMRGNKEKAQEMLRKYAGDFAAKPLDLLKPPPVTSLFQETAPFWRKELGIPMGGFSKVFSKWARSDHWTRPNWNWVKMAGMDATSKLAYQVVRDSQKQSTKAWERGIKEYFDPFSTEERQAITEILEMEGKDSVARNAAPVHVRQYDPHLVDAAAYVKTAFGDIAEEELKYNILNQTVRGYVTHMFNGNPAKVQNYEAVLQKRGHSTAEWSEKMSPFSLHRRIASIDDMRMVFGDDAILTDVAEILFRRKRMSLEMLANKKWLLDIQATHGFGAKVIEAAKSGVPKGIKDMMVDRRSTAHEISDLSQFWVREEIDLRRWGFLQPRDDYMGSPTGQRVANEENLKMLRWLTSGRSVRKSASELFSGLKGNRTAPDTLLNYTGKVNPKITLTSGAVSRTVDINDYLDAAMTTTGKNEINPAVSEVLAALGFPKWRDIPLKDHRSILKSFDKRLRKDIGPLSEVLPQLRTIFNPKARRETSWARTAPGSTPEALKSLVEGLSKPVKQKMVPGLSTEVIIRAKAYRRKLGDASDLAAPHPEIFRMVRGHLKDFNMRPEQTKELLEVMFDKKTLKSLNARQADQLELFLGLNRMDGTSKGILKGTKRYDYIQRYRSYTGEQLVEVKIPVIKGTRPSIIETNLSSRLDVLGPQQTAAKEARTLAERDHAQNVAVLKAYTSKSRDLSNLLRDIKSAKSKRNKISGKKNPIAWSKANDTVEELSKKKDALVAKYGDGTALQSKIERFNAAIKKSEEAQTKSKAVTTFHSLRERWLKAEDKAIRYPGVKEFKKNANNLRGQVKAGAKRLGLDAGDAPIGQRKVIPEKAVKDPRLAGDLLTGEFERPALSGGQLTIERTPGTVGPQMTAVGEHIDQFRYSTFLLPEGHVALLDDISSSLYSDGEWRKIATLMQGYDFSQAYFKARVMAPFIEFHKRNAVTDVSLAMLKAGLALFHTGHFVDFTKVMTYGLKNDLVDIQHLTSSAAASGAVMGAEAGGAAGLWEGYQKGEGFADTTAQMISHGFKGALGGAAIGLGAGTVGGKLVKEGLHGVRKAGEKAHGKDLGKQTITLAGGAKFTVSEFHEEMAKRGVFNTQIQSELLEETGSMLFAMAKSAGKHVPKGAVAAAKAKQTIFMQDTFRAGELATTIPIRTMLFTILAKESGNLGIAAQGVKKYLYDYSNLNMFERRVLRRMIPFYTWSKHALGANWDGMMRNPGMYSAQLKPFVGFAKDDGVDPADKPDWLSNKLARFSVRFNPVTGEKEIEAKQGYGLVQEELIGVWKDMQGVASLFGNRDEASRILSRGPFGVTSLFEGLANFDFFRQGNITAGRANLSAYDSGGEWDNAPEWLQRALGYHKDPMTGKSKVDPRASWFLREIQPSRVYSIAKRVYETDEEGRRQINWLSLAGALLGEKVYTYGPEQRLYRDRAKLERVASWLSKLGFTKPVILSTGVGKYKTEKKRKQKQKRTAFDY